MPSQRSRHSARVLVWLLPAIVVVVCLLSISSPAPDASEAQEPRKSSQRLSDRLPHSPSNQATSSNLSLGTNLVKRAENETLIYAPTKQLQRETLANTVYPEALFSRRAKVDGPLTFSEQTLSAIETKFTPATVKDFLDSKASAFRLPLTESEDVVALVDNVLTRDAATVSLFGSLAHEPDSQVHLVVHDGAVFGNISRLGREEFYEITPAGDGDIAIREIDPSQLGACNGSEVLGNSIDLSLLEIGENDDTSPNSEEEPASEIVGTPLTTIDLVVGYGRQAAVNAGGVAAIEARILAAVDQVNLAFFNSELPLQAFLAGTIQDPDYEFPGRIPSGSNATLSGNDELGDLNNPRNGRLDAVTDLRSRLGADHATFIVRSNEGGAAGVAFLNGDSGIVALNSLTASAATFTHELGHSLGCRHAWGDDSGSGNLNRSSYGWRFITASGRQRRTVMASNRSPFITRLPYFSNPNLQVDGANTGAVRGFNGTGDPTVDQDLVEGGGNGTFGAGYDGSNRNLGANNAGQITAAMTRFSNRRVRTEPFPQGTIEVFQVESEATLSNENAFVSFNSASSPVTMNFVITNSSGANSLDRLATNITGPDASSFSVTQPAETELAVGQSTNFAVTYTPSPNLLRNATLEIQSSALNMPSYTVPLSGGVRTAILTDGLEDAELTGPFINSPANEFEFTMNREDASTPTGRTGPSGPFEGDFYRYTEASAGGGASRTGQFAVETTLDLSQETGALFEFRYHMYGENIGSLHLDVIADGTVFPNLWQRIGEQQESSSAAWSLAQVDLSQFDGRPNVTIRLRGVLEGGIRSDIAIDDLKVFSAPTLSAYEEHLTALNLSTGENPPEGLGPLDDFNNDGIANLVHFASGGNLVTGAGPNLISSEGLTPNGRITFPVLNGLSGVNAGIETSSDLYNLESRPPCRTRASWRRRHLLLQL